MRKGKAFTACHRRSIRYIRAGMKSTTLFAAAAAGLFLVATSCERHEWAETKKLHEKHGHAAHGEGHDAAHGDAHGEAAHGDKHEVEKHEEKAH
jgi:hypothetical protein